jgi:hypothetical protein
MSLLSKVSDERKGKKKGASNQIVTEISTPSGFLPLDYANGVRVTAYDEYDRPTGYTDLIGLVNGTMTTTIGLSGTGKSALAIELSASGIHKFGDMSAVQHHDLEMASTMQRPMKILRIPPSLLRNTYEMYRERGAETVVDMFADHCKVKIDNRKEYYYNTGVKNLYNEDIWEYYPSAVLLDSLAMFKSEDIDLSKKDTTVDNVTHNMIAAQSAKFNKGVLTQMIGYGKTANVSLNCVNHLNPNVNTGFLPKPSQHMYLTQDESMPGGSASLYLANNIIKLKVLKKFDMSKSDKCEYGIPGFIAEARMLKSRTNASNVPIEMIFDQRRGGFSKALTLLHYVHQLGLLQGPSTQLFIPGLQRTRFTRKTFEEVALRDPEVMMALVEAALPSLQSMLSTDTGRGAEETSSQRLDAMYLALEDHQRDVEEAKKLGWVDFD